MLGQWKGWGMLSIDEGEDQPIYEEVEGLISGVQMKLVTRIYSASARESIDPVWDAATGVAALEIGDLMREETLYVSLLPDLEYCLNPASLRPVKWSRRVRKVTVIALVGWGAPWGRAFRWKQML